MQKIGLKIIRVKRMNCKFNVKNQTIWFDFFVIFYLQYFLGKIQKLLLEVILMQFKNCPEQSQMQQYFNQLPSYIQENIEQSGIKIQSMEQLKNCAESFNNL